MSYDRHALEAELVRDEGERLTVYRCTAGKQTIGIGRNLDGVGISVAETRQLGITKATAIARGITVAQSRALFANDIARVESDLDARLSWWRSLDDVRQRVLINMCFNLGINGLLCFKNTLAMINAHRFADAAAGMAASLWHRQVGARALRLESMMRTGRTVRQMELVNTFDTALAGVALLIGAYFYGRSDGKAIELAAQARVDAAVRVEQEKRGALVDQLGGLAAQQETARSGNVREIYRVSSTVTEKPVYRNVCVDADGVRLLDQAAAVAGGEDPGGVPAATGASAETAPER